MVKHFVNASIFFPKSIYSYKDGGLITVCNAVYSAGYQEMGSKLISDRISLNYTMNKMQHALYQFHWGPWMLCLSMHRMKSEYFKIWSRGTKWPAGIIWVLHLFAGFHLWYYLIYPTDRSRQLSWTARTPDLGQATLPTKLYVISQLSVECWEELAMNCDNYVFTHRKICEQICNIQSRATVIHINRKHWSFLSLFTMQQYSPFFFLPIKEEGY